MYDKTWEILQEAIAVVGQQRIVTKLSGNIHEEYSTNWLYRPWFVQT